MHECKRYSASWLLRVGRLERRAARRAGAQGGEHLAHRQVDVVRREVDLRRAVRQRLDRVQLPEGEEHVEGTLHVEAAAVVLLHRTLEERRQLQRLSLTLNAGLGLQVALTQLDEVLLHLLLLDLTTKARKRHLVLTLLALPLLQAVRRLLDDLLQDGVRVPRRALELQHLNGDEVHATLLVERVADARRADHLVEVLQEVQELQAAHRLDDARARVRARVAGGVRSLLHQQADVDDRPEEGHIDDEFDVVHGTAVELVVHVLGTTVELPHLLDGGVLLPQVGGPLLRHQLSEGRQEEIAHVAVSVHEVEATRLVLVHHALVLLEDDFLLHGHDLLVRRREEQPVLHDEQQAARVRVAHKHRVVVVDVDGFHHTALDGLRRQRHDLLLAALDTLLTVLVLDAHVLVARQVVHLLRSRHLLVRTDLVHARADDVLLLAVRRVRHHHVLERGQRRQGGR
eukprot:Rhum_TRINITY_DN22780_c0_g1::Rhum_TRINITY_DN22780_c0_g1_i1::g.175903::m.175903